MVKAAVRAWLEPGSMVRARACVRLGQRGSMCALLLMFVDSRMRGKLHLEQRTPCSLSSMMRHAASKRQAPCPPLPMPALYQATTDHLYKLVEALLACGLVASKRIIL